MIARWLRGDEGEPVILGDPREVLDGLRSVLSDHPDARCYRTRTGNLGIVDPDETIVGFLNTLTGEWIVQ